MPILNDVLFYISSVLSTTGDAVVEIAKKILLLG